MIESLQSWFLSLGPKYGVDPLVFGAIYVGAIPFFSASVAWLVRNLRRGRSPVAPLLSASFFFVSAYLYLIAVGRNIPSWVYFFLVAMIAYGAVATVSKVRRQLSHRGAGNLKALVLICAALAGEAGWADTPTAALEGLVTDPSEAVIAGARIVVRSVEGGFTRSASTNESGLYSIDGLTAGRYEVLASAPNFRSARRDELILQVGEVRRLNFPLVPGDVSETIIVSADPALVQTESAAQSIVTPGISIRNLPLNGRQLQNLALLIPGVAAGWNWSTAANRYGKARENLEGAFAVNGARARSNDFILDGMPINLRQYGVINFEPSVEAVQEFQVVTSIPEAQFGRTMGATVNIVTRGGSNGFHGALYEFFRNDKLDANDTFNSRAGLPRGKLRQNQFGGSLGGPLVANKHFFFVNTELLKIREGVETRLTGVPTPEEASGILHYTAPSGERRTVDLSSRITPVSRRLLGLYPQPNTAGPSGLNYASALTIHLDDYQYHVRTDHHFTGRDIVNARLSWNLNDQVYIVNRFGGPFIPGFSLPNPERTLNGVLGYTRSAGSAFLNEARLGFNRYANPLENGDGSDAARFGLPNGNASASGIPFIQFAGGNLENVGGQPWFNRDQNELTVTASDTFTAVRGRHSLKAGAGISRLHYNTRGAFNQRGTLSFDGSRNGIIPAIAGNESARILADLLLGLPFEASLVVGDFGRGYRQWAWHGFIQDRWRATDRLTLTGGLRYEYSSPWTEVNRKLSNLVPGEGVVRAGVSGFGGLYRPDRNNFGPRLGFAYNLDGQTRTVIRGGLAVLHETLLQANSVQLIENNPPFSAAAITRNPTPFSQTEVSTTLLDLRALARPSRNIGAIGAFRNPYTLQFSLSVQHRLGSDWMIETVYSGLRGVRLPLYRNINQVPIDSLSADSRARIAQAIAGRQDTTPLLAPLRPYPDFDAIVLSENIASSTYHGGTVRLERRWSSGVHVRASYTLAKSIDNASDFDSFDPSETVLSARNLQLQRGPSSFDITHRFTASFVYELPLPRSWHNALFSGWTLNGVLTAQSGQPFTPFVSSFDPFRNETFNRPDVVGRPEVGVPEDYAFNPAAFAAPPLGTFGNAGRNIVRGDGFHSIDLAIARSLSLAESMRLQIRVEAVNAFNQVNYQGPVTNLASSAGAFIAAAPPRIMQAGAKITF